MTVDVMMIMIMTMRHENLLLLRVSVSHPPNHYMLNVGEIKKKIKKKNFTEKIGYYLNLAFL